MYECTYEYTYHYLLSKVIFKYERKLVGTSVRVFVSTYESRLFFAKFWKLVYSRQTNSRPFISEEFQNLNLSLTIPRLF